MTLPPKPPVSPTLQVPAGLETVYANLARISHSPADIVIDFAHLMPAETNAVVKARVLMSPLSAKLLLRALRQIGQPANRLEADIFLNELRRFLFQKFFEQSHEGDHFGLRALPVLGGKGIKREIFDF